MKTIKVGVFPLRNIILYPSTTLPLIVQDECYIKMVKDSIKHNFPIAIGLGDDVLDEVGNVIPRLLRPKEVMGLGKASIVEEYEDGSCYVIFTGIGRIALNIVIHQVPYLLCHAHPINDREMGTTTLVGNPISKMESLLRSWLKTNISAPAYLETVLENTKTIDEIIYHVAAFMVKDREVKQILLETTSVVERIQMIDALFAYGKSIESCAAKNAIKSFEWGDFLLVGTEQ